MYRKLLSKRIYYALLLVGPEAENPIETAQVIADAIGNDLDINYTNDLEKSRVDEPKYEKGRALIPVSFYYLENLAVSDETLT
jgi:hypothetical protein